MTMRGGTQRDDNDLVLSFLALRRAVGLLGFFLPAILLAYAVAIDGLLLPTMSDYFYSPMREVFVGTLCAQAVFLWSYEGYRAGPGEIVTDRRTARAASLGALGIAWLPTGPDPVVPGSMATDCTVAQCLLGTGPVAVLHVVAATLFFGALAVFCLVLFVRGVPRGGEKRGSNRIYRLCGGVIVAAMVAIATLLLTGRGAAWAAWSPVFWLEVVATLAFATSWLVKGDALRPLVRMAAPTA